jgi:hypothetical protein
MAKRDRKDNEVTLKELLEARESLNRLWPDLEKDDNWFKSIEKLSLYIPEWVLAVGILAGILLFAYFSHSLEVIGFSLFALCLCFIEFRRGFEKGCIQGFKDALAAVQRAIDQEEAQE